MPAQKPGPNAPGQGTNTNTLPVVGPGNPIAVSQLLSLITSINTKDKAGPLKGAVSSDLTTVADNVRKLSNLLQSLGPTSDGTGSSSGDTGASSGDMESSSGDMGSSSVGDTVSAKDTMPNAPSEAPVLSNEAENDSMMEISSTVAAENDASSEAINNTGAKDSDVTNDVTNDVTDDVISHSVPLLSVLANAVVKAQDGVGRKEEEGPGTPTHQELVGSPKVTPIGILKHTSQFDTPVSLSKVSWRERERERGSACVHACVCVSHDSVYVCVCVCECVCVP